MCFSILPALLCLPLSCLPYSLQFMSVYHKMTQCLSSLFPKPVRSSCCGRGGSGVKLFPPRARRRACSLDEQAAAWSQSSQVSALRGGAILWRGQWCLVRWRKIWLLGANIEGGRKVITGLKTRGRSLKWMFELCFCLLCFLIVCFQTAFFWSNSGLFYFIIWFTDL